MMAAMTRVGILSIWQESNQFNPVPTSVRDFQDFHTGGGADGLADFAEGEEVGGFVDGLSAWNRTNEPVGLFMAQAWPAGALALDARRWLLRQTAAWLDRAGRLDAVLLALHGALVAEDSDDVDGMVLARVREAVGTNVPIVATIDLHAMLTAPMVQHADVIVAYHTNPHVDRYETGRRAAGVLLRILDGSKATVAWRRLPMNTSGEVTVTAGPVLSPIWQRLAELETGGRALSAAVLMAQPWLDVPRLGWSVYVAADGDPGLAERCCEELADMCWERRSRLTTAFAGASEAAEAALACAGRPVVIADGADSTNSGAAGDSVHLARELSRRTIPEGALTIMVDPDAVAHARRVGPGGGFDHAIGGKRDNIFSRPLPVTGTVLFVRPVRYVLTGHLGGKLRIDMGDGAAVRIGNLVVLLVERTGPGSSPEMYRCVGLEPKDFKIVVVKSPAGFRADYESFAAHIILTACPGCANPRLTELPYTRASRPCWPLDDIDDWRDVDWCRAQE